MKTNNSVPRIHVEFYDHSDQPLLDGYASEGTATIPAVGDTFQGTDAGGEDELPTYVVERRHFKISSDSVTARIYGRDVKVTGGL